MGYYELKFSSHDHSDCLLYTSDAADEEDSVDLGGRRIIKKKKLRRVTQTYLFRCRIAVGIDPRAPFLSILPRKPLKCGKTAKMAVLRDLARWQLRGLK